MLNVWKWYQNCLSVHPVKTQAVSSAILWGVGDLSAQYITHAATKKRLQLSDCDAKFTVNWNRLAVTSMFGFGFVGPVGHFWDGSTQSVVGSSRNWRLGMVSLPKILVA
ncbi:hypothetical protein V8G54_000543 [Vigna mungo]|uniref:Protein Mpv17 n=1 Tax=Vigna mungo TaxID=3915 RepID=A0AAQ3S7C6_VIGMU